MQFPTGGLILGCSFVVSTDCYSFKFLLEQHVLTAPQQHWVGKLLALIFLQCQSTELEGTMLSVMLSHDEPQTC